MEIAIAETGGIAVARAGIWLRWILAAIGIASPAAFAQDNYPSKPIKVIVGAAAGNTQEIPIRAINDRFQEKTGQPFVIDNRAGAGGILAAELAERAAPDGYTIMLANVGQLSVNPYTFRKLPYDAEQFVPITQTHTDQYVFAVHPSVPVKDIAEFIAYAKANPGKVTYASSQLGSPGHLSGVMLIQAAGIDMVHVTYKGVPQAVTDVLGGRVAALFATLEAVGEHLRAGKLHALAVTSEHRLNKLPDVTSFADAGWPGVVSYTWVGLVAPPGTPSSIVEKLSGEVRALLRLPDVVSTLRKANKEPVGSTPAEFAAFLKADRSRWRAAVKASGFKSD